MGAAREQIRLLEVDKEKLSAECSKLMVTKNPQAKTQYLDKQR